MDHFTIPDGTVHIRVPFRCTERYDGGDFFEYPARKGWTEDQLMGRSGFGNRTPAEVEAFFQTWLYFGTLISVLKLNGINVDPAEFITTDGLVTTAALPRRLRDWRMKGNRDAESKAAEKTIAIIKKVGTYMDRYCGVEGRDRERAMRAPSNAIPWPVALEISMSIIALGFVLTGAIRDMYKVPTFDVSWGASPLIKSKLLNAGWCPLDVRRLFLDVGIDGQYYLALAKFPHDTGFHSRCNERSCVARNVDESKYVIAHLHAGPCPHDAATLDVVEIIKEGGIPVLSWVKNIAGDRSGFIVEDARKSKQLFIAISHVWADGLGNPDENSLPICQLERIQARVDSVFPNGPHPVRFWMDTLCIPVAEEYKDLRKKSIALMQEIYKSAFAVLVFDAGIQKLSHSSTPHEKAATLYMSNWVHRLWTFQEGMFAQRLYFQLTDSVEDITADEEPDSNREDDSTGYFPHSARTAIAGHFVILKDFVEMKGDGDPSVGYWLLLPPLAHALQQRTTTRMSDEVICSATILDLDLRDILDVSVDKHQFLDFSDEDRKKAIDKVLAAGRMEVFLRQMRHFRPGIVFHHQKRMQREGYRWAPATMMGTQPGEFSSGINKAAAVSFKGNGLSVRYPGFILEPVHAGSQVEIAVKFKYYNHHYRVQIFPESEEPVVWDSSAVYAVVTALPLASLSDSGTEAVVGILKDPAAVHQEQVKKRRSRNVLHLDMALRCEWRAWVEPMETETNVAITGDMLGETQKWRLV
ncbi:Heterokaryon incompatibility [Mycena sanguinolenta]|uniref:Heterokaryon incompatibility n=1 Tax=Mycena sanguinolenta TaxID=230812 RepID=A0A8H6ZCJ9_9AGAR|nr:Heterokaryon incompatibility [Mycena sanguinolenta]